MHAILFEVDRIGNKQPCYVRFDMRKNMKNTSSFHVVKDGRMIHGNAAFLHIASKAGGVDGFLAQYGEEVMREALSKVLDGAREQKVKLHRVK